MRYGHRESLGQQLYNRQYSEDRKNAARYKGSLKGGESSPEWTAEIQRRLKELRDGKLQK